jgi:AraC family transcriptional regulator of adaptative response / DNA-3-methyladenine glycosylase II
MDVPALLGFLGAHAVPGIEEYVDGTFRRSLSLPHGVGIIALRDAPAAAHVECEIRLEDLRDLTAAVQRCRRLLDLDADQQAIAAFLGDDPLLAPLVAACPGRRVPGHVDAVELAVRTVLGRRSGMGVARARTARLIQRYGRPLSAPTGGITHTFPDVKTLAAAEPADLAVPRDQRLPLLTLTRALADGTILLDPGADRDHVDKQLVSLPGVDPWTVAYLRMRALGDPDILIPDLKVRRALRQLRQATEPAAIEALSSRWRPWRSYAVQHLWTFADAVRRPTSSAD